MSNMRMKIQPLPDGTREVDIKLLDDGTGRTCTHWLRECPEGKIKIVGHEKLRAVTKHPEVRYYQLACRPEQNTVSSQKRGPVRYICTTTGDPQAATCPKCLATPEVVKALAVLPDEPDPRLAQIVMDTVRQLQGEVPTPKPQQREVPHVPTMKEASESQVPDGTKLI